MLGIFVRFKCSDINKNVSQQVIKVFKFMRQLFEKISQILNEMNTLV